MTTRAIPAATGRDTITHGPVHLDVTDLDRSAAFWREAVGLEPLPGPEGAVRLGAGGRELVRLHPGAVRPALRRHSGLYHLAIHLPGEGDFARALARLSALRVPQGPTDHVFSKATYLSDPDGIGIELTLETPERMGWAGMGPRGPELIDAEGRPRGMTEPLDVDEVLATLPDRDLARPMPAGTRIGHVHLHVGDLAAAAAFYTGVIGFRTHMDMSAIGMVDFSAGGRFPHRMAVNVWQGQGAPQPPPGTAGLRHITLHPDGPDGVRDLLGRAAAAGVPLDDHPDGALVRDPAGNAVLVSPPPAG